MVGEASTFSLSRAKLLSLIKKHEPITIVDLSKKSKLSRTNVYHHLNHLKKSGLIVEKKEIKKAGQPVMVATNKANPMSLKTISFFEKMADFLQSQKGSREV